jgi:hypothetical protein
VRHFLAKKWKMERKKCNDLFLAIPSKTVYNVAGSKDWKKWHSQVKKRTKTYAGAILCTGGTLWQIKQKRRYSAEARRPQAANGQPSLGALW